MCQMVITPEYSKYEAKWVHGQRGKGDTPKQIGHIKDQHQTNQNPKQKESKQTTKRRTPYSGRLGLRMIGSSLVDGWGSERLTFPFCSKQECLFFGNCLIDGANLVYRRLNFV